MAEVNEKSWRSLQQIERELFASIGSKSPGFPKQITQLLSSYRLASQEVIFQDFEFARKRGVDGKLWDAHGKINNKYRKQLKQIRESNGKRKAVEQRKLEKLFLDFIKSSQRFYRGYIQLLNSHYEGIRELSAVANRLTLPTLPVEDTVSASGNLHRLIFLSCHQILIRLGDLSRWRETQFISEDRNWGPAEAYYHLAGRIYPASGASHNQLAVIALQDANHLGAVYHLYRALAVEEPHPHAKGNLKVEFKKIEDAWSKGEPLARESEKKDQLKTKVEVEPFLRLHSRCFGGKFFAEHEALETETLGQLAIILKQRSIDSVLAKMALINIAAEYLAGQLLRNELDSIEALQSFSAFQKLNVRMFLTLLQTLQAELEQQVGDAASSNDGTNNIGLARVSAVTRRVLPALRHYSSWLIANATILVANNSHAVLNVHVNELWKAYARVLTLLASFFLRDDAQIVVLDYLLDEDESTLGFVPFGHETQSRRYYKKDGVSPKPRHYDNDSNVQRHHPNKEMLGRLSDLLIDGMRLQCQEDFPIFLDESSRTFAYSEDTLNKRNYQSQFEHTSAQLADVTHIEDTPLPQVVSIEDTTPVSVDVDSQRMVDDLVSLEAGCDQDAIGNVIEQAPIPGRPAGEDTSYGLLGSATLIEYFGQESITNRRSSRPLLPNTENSPFTPPPGEEQLPASPRSPVFQMTPSRSRHGSQHAPMLQQQSKYLTLPSSNSSMPTPTFENSIADRFPVSTGIQDPSVYARHVRRALDETKFRSSNIFDGSTSASNGQPK